MGNNSSNIHVDFFISAVSASFATVIIVTIKDYLDKRFHYENKLASILISFIGGIIGAMIAFYILHYLFGVEV